ncbi:hypothetical protein BJX61DRAFT_1272 [Aspergillus egyptiacus]|nr:hypothetical protein BJX61DRAFT_1272 [Aspergillus egyptiacus]
MNTFASAMARALPSIGRQCHPRASVFRQTKLFSSTTQSMGPRDRKEESHDLERQLLGVQSPGPAGVNSTDSPVSRMMRGNKDNVTVDYSKLAEDLEAAMLKNPYSDQNPAHHLHVFSHKHNTVLTLTRPNGNPIMTIGCGQIGFRKGGRRGYEPAYQLTQHFFAQIREKGLLMDIQRLEIIFRGFQQGREAFVKVLMGDEGKHIRGLVSRVADATRLKFGGPRSKRVRRL